MLPATYIPKSKIRSLYIMVPPVVMIFLDSVIGTIVLRRVNVMIQGQTALKRVARSSASP